jgi:DNA polymerase III epsilon subunit-like protein
MNEALAIINGLLKIEQEREPINDIDDITSRLQRRVAIKQQLTMLELELQLVREQVKRLPAHPPLAHIRWAKAVRAFPNLAFLEIDTTGLSADADIIRLKVLNTQGTAVLDQFIQPSHPLPAETTRITGISNQDVMYAPTVIQVWEDIRDAVRGKYVLSYNLDFDMGKLKETTKRHSLEVITIIGECLMQRAMLYYDISSYPKLETLCGRVGHQLPEQPGQSALDRARGQFHLLEAMANAITGTTSSTSPSSSTNIDVNDNLADFDEPPF